MLTVWQCRRYEGNLGLTSPHKKSGGQLGSAETATADPQANEGASFTAHRGVKATDNLPNERTVGEQSLTGGVTLGTDGSTRQDESRSLDAGQSRRAEGYGGEEGYERDMNPDIGA